MTAVKMLYEGSREPSRADVFYEALCTVFQPNFRAHGLIVYGRSRPDAGAEWGAATLHFQRGLDDELVHQFCEHYHLKNVWAANEPGMQPGHAVTSSMLFPDSELKQTEYWADWLRPQDIFYALGGMLVGDSQHQVKASFVRSEARGPFTATDLRICRLLMPQLKSLWELQRRIEEIEAAGAAAMANLVSLTQAVFGLDTGGRLRFANEAGERHLRSGRVVRQQGQGLTSESPAVAAGLRAKARAAPLVRAFRGHEIATVDARAFATTAGEVARVVVVSPRSAPSPALHGLQLAGLTEAERDVLRLMVAGHRIKQIADLRSSSQHTVRSQVAAILHKTGCRSQLELLGRMITAAQG